METNEQPSEWTALDLESQTLVESSPSNTFMTRGNGGLTSDGLTVVGESSLFNASSVRSVANGSTESADINSPSVNHRLLTHQSRLPPPVRICQSDAPAATSDGSGNSFAKEVKIVNTPRPVVPQPLRTLHTPITVEIGKNDEPSVFHEPVIFVQYTARLLN
jgi:hypothetical protein